MRRFTIETEQDMLALGRRIAEMLNKRGFVALYGDLGAGKTAFVRGIASGLGLDSRVSSPTFTIVNEYLGPTPLFHFDMYRIIDASQLYDIGWEDYLASGALCVIEWSENIEDAIPEDAVRIFFEKTSENGRRIRVKKC